MSRRPLQPIFDPPKRRGVSPVGNTPIVTVPGALVTAMLAAGPLGMWNYNEASGTVLDHSGNGHDSTSVTGAPTYQSWTGPDGVLRMEFTGADTIAFAHNAEFNPATNSSGVGITLVGVLDPTADYDFGRKDSLTQSDSWRVYWDATDIYVRLGRTDTTGAHRVWRNTTWTPPAGIFLMSVFIQDTSGTDDLPVMRVNGVDVPLTYFAGGGSWDSAAAGSLEVPASNAGRVGPHAIYSGQPSLSAIEAAATAEGWY